MPSAHDPRFSPCTLSASQTWLNIVGAGSRIDFTSHGPGTGAAIFSWSLTDPYEQLSDAYTFMELRRVRPAVGDQLYSTLRRPMITLERDDAGYAIDLLRHDYWWPRDKCLGALVEQAKASAIPAPLWRDWPYAVNIFARTLIGENGDFFDDGVEAKPGTRIELRAKFDLVLAVIASGMISPAIDILVNPTVQFPDRL
jgi:uncharacterized protein YcgI (DUF1989 family)